MEQHSTYEDQLVELLRKCRDNSTKLERDELARIYSGDELFKELTSSLERVYEYSEFLEQAIDRVASIKTVFFVIERNLSLYEADVKNRNVNCKLLFTSAASLSMVLLGTITSATSSKELFLIL